MEYIHFLYAYMIHSFDYFQRKLPNFSTDDEVNTKAKRKGLWLKDIGGWSAWTTELSKSQKQSPEALNRRLNVVQSG